MSFIETPRFPENISFGSAGGPMYAVRRVEVDSGHRKKLARWTYSLHFYDVGLGLLQDDAYELLEFFHVCGGGEDEFRYKDWQDYKSNRDMSSPISDTDQTIGTGDGSTEDFQLIKTYVRGASTRARKISKPLSGALVSIDDVSQPTGWTLNTVTGLLSFTVAPALGEVIKVGFEFDVPVEFGDSRLSLQFDDQGYQTTSVILQEVRI